MRKNNFLSFFFLMLFLGLGNLNAQIANVGCNTTTGTPWVKNTFANLSVTSSSGWSSTGNVIDTDTNNRATGSILFGGSRTLRVTDSVNDYPAGTYAGFKINVNNLGTASTLRIKTFLNGVEQESKQVGSQITIVNLNGAYEAGFITGKAFDAVQVEYSLIGLTGSIEVYHAILNRSCPGPDLPCNTQTNIQKPLYTAYINNARTGVSGINIGSVANAENVIDTDNNNYASLTNLASIVGASYLSVADGSKIYSAGTFASFEIENAILFGFNGLNTVTIKTFLNGTEQESQSGSSLFLDVPILDANTRRFVGFETTKDFNEVQIIVSQPIGINIGTTKVYNLVLTRPCEGVDFASACGTANANKMFTISRPDFPVNINTGTGVSGVATTLSMVKNANNVVDDNPTNYAEIILPLTGLTTGSLSVIKTLADFPAGTYAGFDIENTSIFNAQFLQNTTISTYNNGLLQESASGNGLLIGVGSDLVASSGRYTLGFVTKKAFDEVRISINSVTAFNWGTTKVHNLVAMKPCAKTIDCNSSYYWNLPDFPVVLSAERTGIKSLACAGCSVNNPDNVIDNDPTNYSRITLAAGIGNSGSISVVDPTATYPKGTFAGFTVKDRYFIVQGDLFEYITVNTYLDGVLQESKTSADLFDLTLLIPIWGTGTKNVGFYTTKPFDEVQVVARSLGSIVNVLDVYGPFIDTRSSNGGSLSCKGVLVANPDAQTINAGSTGTTSVLANDTYNGTPATTANVTLSQVSTSNPGVTLDPNTGLVTVAPGTPAGTYTVNYQICDKTTPDNCKTSTVTVTVPTPVIDAVTETFPGVPSNTGGTTASVLANDTLGGQPATTSNVNLTGTNVPTGFTLNPDGTVTVAPNTPAGNYNITYQICDKVNPSNCDTATSVVVVSAPAITVVANPDSLGPITSQSGGTTTSVLANDTVNGQPATTSNVTLTGTNVPTGLTLNPDGTITVAPNTPLGTYNITYTICSIEAPSVCSTSTSTVTVKGTPDMELKMSSSAPIISIGSPIQVFYRVTNVGTDPTTGLITLTAIKPTGMNTFTPLVVPTGWTATVNANNIVFTTTNVMAANSYVDIVVQYTSTDTVIGVSRNFVGRITNGSGGETNTTNNIDSFSLILQVGL